MSEETLSLSDLQRLADDILSGFAMDVIRPAAIKKLCEAVKEVATPIPSAPKTWAKPPTAAAIRWMVGEVELDAAFKLRSDRTLLLCSMVREFLKGTADGETEPALKPTMLRVFTKSQERASSTDFWQASDPVPTTTPEALREWLHNNPQLTDDARVKFLLGMCHAALGELIKERDSAKTQAAKAQENVGLLTDRALEAEGQLAKVVKKDPWQATAPIPNDALALCGFILNNTLTDDQRMAELLDRCRAMIMQLSGNNKDLIAERTELESILGAGYWAGSGGDDETLPVVAQRLRSRFDQINSRVLPKEVATLEQKIVEAKEAWDQGDGRSINEVFRSAEQLPWTVRAQILARNDGLASDGSSGVVLSPQHVRQLAELQRENARLNEELTAAKNERSVAQGRAEEADARAAHNEAAAIEEGHRVIVAERRLTELTSLLDQHLQSPLADADRDLSDIDQLLNRTTLLVTLCSGAPWSFSEAGDHLVMDADRRPVATISDPTPGNFETRRYNGEFIAASRGLIVHLVEVCRTLVANVRHLRQSNKTLQSVKRELETKLGDAGEELRHAKTLETDLQRTINNLREDLSLAQEGEREACASAEIERAKNISVDDLHRMAPACLSCCDNTKWDSRWKNGRLYMHLFQRSRCLDTIQGARNDSGEVEAADVLFNLLAVCAHWKLSIPLITTILRELAGLPPLTRDPEAIYLIQDGRSYVGNDVSWWGPNSSGYTCQIDEAGLYTEDFCRRLRSTDVVWRAADIFPLATRVIDVQRIHSADLKPVVFDKKPDGEK